MNSKYFLSAIHQRVESDGTERVEESMTQRLENILNSKRLLIHAAEASLSLELDLAAKPWPCS